MFEDLQKDLRKEIEAKYSNNIDFVTNNIINRYLGGPLEKADSDPEKAILCNAVVMGCAGAISFGLGSMIEFGVNDKEIGKIKKLAYKHIDDLLIEFTNQQRIAEKNASKDESQ